MTSIIHNLKNNYKKFLNNSSLKPISKEENEDIDEIFKVIINKFNKTMQWAAPELIKVKAIEAIYNIIPDVEDCYLNETLRTFWNRFSTYLFFMEDFSNSLINDPLEYYFKYSKISLDKMYSKKRSQEKFDYLKEKVNENIKQNLTPFVVKIISDKDYSFITQNQYNVYMIRSNKTITNHNNVVNFNKYFIDFDNLHKSLIYALV